MKRLAIIFGVCFSPYLYAVEALPAKCTISNGQLTGNYNAVQTQLYTDSCILQYSGRYSGARLVPIGNNHSGKVSHVSVGYADNPNRIHAIQTIIGGAEDNTLAGGRRGRQEVADCFLTDTEFSLLSTGEKEFRRTASDFNRNCKQKSMRRMGYNFYLKMKTDSSNFNKLDAIVMQLHSINDKARYCIPHDPKNKDICNQNNGTVGVSARNVQAYNEKLAQGAVFESGIQPPLSFRIKGDYFYIIATSSLKDSSGNDSQFSPSKACVTNIERLAVKQVFSCPETGNTLTVLYKTPISTSFIKNNVDTGFNVFVRWPRWGESSHRVIIDKRNNNGTWERLVDDSDSPIGSYDNQYPYFKSGIYRQNENPTKLDVSLTYFRYLPFANHKIVNYIASDM